MQYLYKIHAETLIIMLQNDIYYNILLVINLKFNKIYKPQGDQL